MFISVLFFCLVLLATLILSYRLTGLFRQYALKKKILDCPNHRSSHVIPTPRGGGIVFVMVFSVAACCLGLFFQELCTVGNAGLLLASLGVMGLGWLDDQHQLAVRWRLLGHVMSSVCVIYALGGLPTLHVLGWTGSSAWLVDGLAVFYFVWLLNLYNFMDGIDGLAAMEAISVCLAMSLIYAVQHDFFFTLIPLTLAAAVAGFVLWNFPRARLFMGDAGSGFLGFVLGVLSIIALMESPLYFWCWMIVLGGFIVDTSYTLLRRFCAGHAIWEAHRTHAYQHATDYFKQHAIVSWGMVAIHWCWLFPWALLVSLGMVDGLWALVLSYLPLFVLVVWFQAGCEQRLTA